MTTGAIERVKQISQERRQLALVGVGIPLSYQGLPAGKYVEKRLIHEIESSQRRLVMLYHQSNESAYAAASFLAEAYHDALCSVSQIGLKSLFRQRAASWKDGYEGPNLEKVLQDPQILSIVSFTGEVLEGLNPREISWLFAMLQKRAHMQKLTILASTLSRKSTEALFQQQKVPELLEGALVVRVK